MTIKWSKRIAIQYIQSMRSPIEEQSGQTNPQSPLIQRLQQIKARMGNVSEPRKF